MQDKYISLDPANAESTTAALRKALFIQRLHEARGGDLAIQTGVTFGMTAMFVSYAAMRAKGFRAFPVNAKSLPKIAGVAFWGFLGFEFGVSFVYQTVGDASQYKYLLANKKAIMKGETGMN